MSVAIYLAKQEVNPDRLVSELRDPHRSVPFFQNLFGPDISVTASGAASFALKDNQGHIYKDLAQAGTFSFKRYEAHFEAAVRARNRAISDNDIFGLYECLSCGFTSIEVFLRFAAQLWNQSDSEHKIEIGAKISIEDKIEKWIPVLSGGREFDRSNRDWSDFKALKKIRDDEAIHPKAGGHLSSYGEIAEALNLFRTGIARNLINLHSITQIGVPSNIICACFYPDVETVTEIKD